MIKHIILFSCVFLLRLFTLNSNACDLLSYRDYEKVEECLNGRQIVRADGAKDKKPDSCGIPNPGGGSDYYYYDPLNGFDSFSIGTKVDAGKESLLYSEDGLTIYQNKNALGQNCLSLKRAGGKAFPIALLSHVSSTELPVAFRVQRNDVILFRTIEEQIGYVESVNDFYNTRYIYTTQDYEAKPAQLTNFICFEKELYFLKTPTAGWPEVWKYNFLTRKHAQVQTSFPFQIVKFNLYLAKDGNVMTVIRYRDKWRSYATFGTGIFGDFKRHNSLSGTNDIILGEYGWLLNYQNVLFSQTIYCPFNKNELDLRAGKVLFSEKEYLKMNFPLVFQKVIHPISDFVTNSVDSNISIPIHIYQPQQGAEPKKVPVILSLHGGPEEHRDANFIAGIQYLVNSLGCMLVDINYRGSTGFSKRLATLAGQIETGAVDDVISVRNYLESNFSNVDSSRIALLGEHFGGYLSALAMTSLTHGQKFRGGVSMNAFYDWPEMFKTMAERQGLRYARANYRDRFGFVFDEDLSTAQQLSITSRIQNLSAPLYVVHGSDDSICPINQVTLLKNASEKTGSKLTTIEIFNGADHNLVPKKAEAYAKIALFYQQLFSSSQ